MEHTTIPRCAANLVRYAVSSRYATVARTLYRRKALYGASGVAFLQRLTKLEKQAFYYFQTCFTEEQQLQDA